MQYLVDPTTCSSTNYLDRDRRSIFVRLNLIRAGLYWSCSEPNIEYHPFRGGLEKDYGNKWKYCTLFAFRPSGLTHRGSIGIGNTGSSISSGTVLEGYQRHDTAFGFFHVAANLFVVFTGSRCTVILKQQSQAGAVSNFLVCSVQALIQIVDESA